MRYARRLWPAVAGLGGLSLLAFVPAHRRLAADDAGTVAALDTRYQAAVKANDWRGVDSLLPDDFVLVTGGGHTYGKQDFVNEARTETSVYEHQEEVSQRVRLWGNTAVVTALLWIKGTQAGKPFDEKVWFSDMYMRTPAGWRYVFGQSSLPLPAPATSPKE